MTLTPLNVMAAAEKGRSMGYEVAATPTSLKGIAAIVLELIASAWKETTPDPLSRNDSYFAECTVAAGIQIVATAEATALGLSENDNGDYLLTEINNRYGGHKWS